MLSPIFVSEIVETSFEIVHMIAKEKKSHKNGETLIEPGMLKAVGFLLGAACKKKMAKISFSDSTIKTPIDELARNIQLQVPLFFQFKVRKQQILPDCRSC